MIQKGQWQVRHELGDRSEPRNSDSVDQQVPVSTFSRRGNGCCIDAENLTAAELILVVPLAEYQRESRQHYDIRNPCLPVQAHLDPLEKQARPDTNQHLRT